MNETAVVIPNFNDHWDKDLRITLAVDQHMQDVFHVFLKGRIDTYNADFFQSQLDKILEYGIVKLVFRCSSLEYVSSSGLGAFVVAHQKFVQKGGVFVFTDLQPKVLEVFQLLGFTRLFCIANDSTDANYFLRGDNNAKREIFPMSFKCPICDKKLSAKKSGRFRCSNCKSVLDVSDSGSVSF
ncbi:MAG: anti-sigma factor antagonist [Treponema sp.]|nr:anti-sigma factor antagonist [Treponema sp.]MBR4631080.1 anti-sigma factor antagonist [Treponema sp.]